MAEIVAVIAGNRSYEFRRDEIRLTMLSFPDTIERIQDTFQFHHWDFGSSASPFGDEDPTFPPGVGFDLGYVPYPEGQITPVRHLYISDRRVAISVAGHTSAAEFAFGLLSELLSAQRSPDGHPVLGEPYEVLNQSEILFRGSFRPDAVLAPALRGLYTEALSGSDFGDAAAHEILVPDLRLLMAPSDLEFDPDSQPAFRQARLGIRPHRIVDDMVYRSVAPLDTESHLTLLDRIETALGADTK